MKKLFLIVLGAFILSTSAMAWNLIPLSVNYDEEQPISHGNPKAPMLAPKVYIEDYTLLFAVDHPDYILNIMDEDGAVVYSTVVYSTQTQVVLPSTLSGLYEIQLDFGGNYIFVGELEL